MALTASIASFPDEIIVLVAIHVCFSQFVIHVGRSLQAFVEQVEMDAAVEKCIVNLVSAVSGSGLVQA